ncbi:MAG: Gfo/Idh/MocA family oxidoreductase [Alistipes sp.]
MKKIILFSLVLFGLLSIGGCSSSKNDYKIQDGMIVFNEPARAKGQQSVLRLAVDPIPVVRVGFVGLGMRGSEAVRRYTYLEGVEIAAICDKETANVEKVKTFLAEHNLPEPAVYTGEEGYKQLCEDADLDLVYICTDWEMHVPIALCAMEHGHHAAVEVPAATSIEECWQLVDMAERTQRHCMMLENCCYDFFEMATLNMAQKGLFGTLVHAEGAYIHDLRSLQFNQENGYVDMWRLKYNTDHTGNPYATHGLGPVSQILNIHRGDKMDYLVSVSSDQFGMTEYATQKFGKDSELAKTPYALGDMNTTIIRTHKGRTILIQHDITSPRPYNRHHLISGTKGFAQKYPVQSLAFEPNAHAALSPEQLDSVLTLYEHPITKQIGEIARKVGGHGGMDFIMDYRLIYCLHNGLPLDEDVYDAAEWSCIGELSETSVRHKGMPVAIPDFTRGDWEKTDGFHHAMSLAHP